MRKRVKVEFQDETGTKYSLAVEGRVSREKVLKIMDLMELIDGTEQLEGPSPDTSSSFGKLLTLIDTAYSGKDFSSADIARDYEEAYGVNIPLSMVSTYLSRISERGILKRQKFGNSWVYRRVHIPTRQTLLK